jgi:AraC family ethanolamine operon transcriptional activator
MLYAYSHKHSTDASQHAASLYDWNQRYEQLSAGRFSGNFERLQLGGIHVFKEASNRTLVQSGHVCTGMVAVGAVQRAGAGGRYCGTELRRGSVFGGASDAEFHFLAGADMELAAVSVPLIDLESLQETLCDGEAPAQFQHHDVLPLSDGATHTFQTLLNHALEVAAQGHMADKAQARRMLGISLTEAVLQCTQPAQARRSGLAAVNKRRIVAKARAYMQQQPESVLAMPDVCKAIGASRRALQYAFEEVLQVSPITYLRLMRLNRVRVDLQQPGASSVGDVAARWGFWHLSRFAAEYKALFCELPSVTLQRAR